MPVPMHVSSLFFPPTLLTYETPPPPPPIAPMGNVMSKVTKMDDFSFTLEVPTHTPDKVRQPKSKKDLQSWEENGENSWCEYLENDCEGIRAQETEKLFLLGVSLLVQSNSESLYRHNVLEQQPTPTLCGCFIEFPQLLAFHVLLLQDTEAELNEWEKALFEEASELQKCIVEMEESGEKFSQEAKDCRNQLEKSRKQLQTCRNGMSEYTNELTKPQRQLPKCTCKLRECEISLKKCREYLSESHSQIAKCIKGLKEKSKDLSDEGKKFAFIAGAFLGTAVGVGTGAAIGGPIGILIGTAFGAGIGLRVEVAIATHHEEKLKKTRENLRTCESDLIDCDNVVERCDEVLKKGEKELKELQQALSELEQSFDGCN